MAHLILYKAEKSQPKRDDEEYKDDKELEECVEYVSKHDNIDPKPWELLDK